MKKEKQQLNQEEERNYTFLQKILYLFIFPVLFMITLVLAILTVQGTNVFDLAQSFIPNKDEAKKEEPAQTDKRERDEPEKESQPKTNQEVIMLERQITDKEREITKLVSELKQANTRIKDLETQQQDIKSSSKELAALYERMSTKKAAAIIVELEEDMALLILNNLSVAKKSGILGQLDPEQAARFTKLLAEGE